MEENLRSVFCSVPWNLVLIVCFVALIGVWLAGLRNHKNIAKNQQQTAADLYIMLFSPLLNDLNKNSEGLILDVKFARLILTGQALLALGFPLAPLREAVQSFASWYAPKLPVDLIVCRGELLLKYNTGVYSTDGYKWVCLDTAECFFND